MTTHSADEIFRTIHAFIRRYKSIRHTIHMLQNGGIKDRERRIQILKQQYLDKKQELEKAEKDLQECHNELKLQKYLDDNKELFEQYEHVVNEKTIALAKEMEEETKRGG